MRVIALISQKGGAGKSTLARALSVLAAEEGPSWLVDRDPQKTTSKWMQRRQDGEAPPERPELLDLGTTPLTDAVTALRPQAGTLFIDTRPAVEAPEAEAARVSDFVIVPVRPSIDDIEAVGATLAILRRLPKRALVVVNAAKHARRAVEARAALSRYGVPVCPTHLGDRAIYQDAALSGQGISETKGAGSREADAELRAVWAWVLEVAGHD